MGITRLVCYAALGSLAGCAVNSIAPMGGGVMMISKQASTGFGGMANLKAKALLQAQNECAKQHRDFEVVHIEESKPPYILANFPRVEVSFRCVENHPIK